MTHRTARAHLRRWLWRREIVPVLPALLLVGFWLGGEAALVAAAVLVPALCAVLSPPRPARVTVEDGVSGLPLKATLVEALEAAFAEAPRSGRAIVAFAIGIDDFAELEARHGLNLAEEAQRRVAERVATALRRGDIVARLGPGLYGAAFGPAARADLETAIQVAGRIQTAVREPILAGPARVHLTCSVGFCLGTRAPRPSGDAALSAALDALEEARASGPGAVRAFSAERPRDRARRAELEAEAVAALENGQIRPWFQPQISTDTGAVSGFEALARWEHPARGALTPKDFLPALTATGQIERLGEVMLFHGLTAMQTWERAGCKVPSLGVNFAAEELRNPRLAEKLAWELDRFGLAPERLTVEILETVMVDASDDTITRTIEALARIGCRIDLDDFGTGNASLAALKRFSVRRIKIDRSFVINVDEDRDQQLMVTAILGLAERLGLETLAEGVERVGEHAILAQLGCGHVQGYGIARPMPFEDTIGWMQRHAEKLKETPTVSRRAV